MSVLNAVNGNEIDEIYELMHPVMIQKELVRQQFLKEFAEKRNSEKDLTEEMDDDSDDDSDDGKPNGRQGVVTDYDSVCSENTRDMMSDDDDDEEEDISDFKAIENIESLSDDRTTKVV